MVAQAAIKRDGGKLEIGREALAEDDLKRVREHNWWHADERQLSTFEWGVPPQGVLDQAVALRKRLDAQRDTTLARYKGKLAQEMTAAERKAYGLAVQMIFQNPMASLNPRMRVLDAVMEPLRYAGGHDHKTERQADRQAALQALAPSATPPTTH